MDPGGYGCDLLRSCYETQMVFCPDGDPFAIKWYFCKPGSLALDIPNTFNSRNWSKQDSPWPEIGEVEHAERIWYNGKAPNQMPTYKRIGTDEDFRIGQAAAEPGVQVNPACEIIYGEPPPGGIMVGGEASVSTGLWVTAACPGGITKAMRLWFRSFADPNPALPLYRDLFYVPFLNILACAWLYDGHQYGFFLFRSGATNNFHVQYLIDGVSVVSQGPINLKNCAHWRGLYSPILLPPDNPDPLAFYLYDIWAVPSADPRPF